MLVLSPGWGCTCTTTVSTAFATLPQRASPCPCPLTTQRRRPTLFWLVATAIVLLLGHRPALPVARRRTAFRPGGARDGPRAASGCSPRRRRALPRQAAGVHVVQCAALRCWATLNCPSSCRARLASVGTLLLVHDLGAALWSPQAALFAVLCWCSRRSSCCQGTAGQIDALVTFWITLAATACCATLSPARTGAGTSRPGRDGAGHHDKGVGFLPLLMLLPLAFVKTKNAGQGAAPVWRGKLAGACW